MRQLGVRAARWHHHGLSRSRNTYAFAPCLRSQRSFASRPKRNPGEDEQEVIVRQYEQSTLNSNDRVEYDPEADVKNEQELLRKKIVQLEKELEFLKEGPFGPNSPFIKSLPENDRIKVLEALRKDDEAHREEDEAEEREEKAIDAEFDQFLEEEFGEMAKEEQDLADPKKKVEELPPLPPKAPFEVELKVPDKHQAYVDRFNKTLKNLRNDSTPAERFDVWRSYKRCKELISFFVELVPRDALNMLWDSQARRSDMEPSLSSHLKMLAEDMMSDGRDLTPSQWMDYIEILHENGTQNQALELWEDRKDSLADYGPKEENRYWQLGVKILVANGKIQRAENKAMAFLDADKAHDPRILIPIIIARAQAPSSNNEIQSWTLYLKLKIMLGDSINMADYDAVTVGFLKAGKMSHALAVFKDMMLAGQDSKSDSENLYKTSLGLVGSLHLSSINEFDVNKVSLGALTFLPRSFQNKFFYASWMKRLIGMGEIDSAAMVVELMYERGVKPDPKHLNGIMGAWLREGSPSSRDKAERLGWAMVQERIDQVWAVPDTKPSVHDPETGAGVQQFMQRRVPPANIETFSVLLLYYTRRNQEQLIRYLLQSLDNARVKPNTFFMNHLLYKELRLQNIFGVWSGYNEMTKTVKPDLETFACLWDCGKLQYDRTRQQYDSRFPTARQLHHEMIKWFTSLTPFHQKTARESFSKDLYEQIVRCFCLSLDMHGTLVALRSLRENFGFFPDPDATRILLFLIVRTAAPPTSDKPKSSRRRRISAIPRSKENFEYAANLIDVLRDRKTALLPDHGPESENLEQERRNQFEVDLMSDVLRAVLLRLSKDSETMEMKLKATAEQMGVPNLGLGDPLDIEV